MLISIWFAPENFPVAYVSYKGSFPPPQPPTPGFLLKVGRPSTAEGMRCESRQVEGEILEIGIPALE